MASLGHVVGHILVVSVNVGYLDLALFWAELDILFLLLFFTSEILGILELALKRFGRLGDLFLINTWAGIVFS